MSAHSYRIHTAQTQIVAAHLDNLEETIKTTEIPRINEKYICTENNLAHTCHSGYYPGKIRRR